MKKLHILSTIAALSVFTAGCDMGTPPPSTKNSHRIIELSQRGEYFRILVVNFKDGTDLLVPVTKENFVDWTANPGGGKKKKLKNKEPMGMARELFGDRVESANWASKSYGQ